MNVVSRVSTKYVVQFYDYSYVTGNDWRMTMDIGSAWMFDSPEQVERDLSNYKWHKDRDSIKILKVNVTVEIAK